MSPTNLQVLVSTVSSFFLGPCLRSDEQTPRRSRSRKKKVIVCNQYQHRLYLRPIMPPTTRRRSRMLSAGRLANETQPQENIEVETRGRRRASRKRSKEASLERPVLITKEVLQYRQSYDTELVEDEKKPFPIPTVIVSKHRQSIELMDVTGVLHRPYEETKKELNKPDGKEALNHSDEDQKPPVSEAPSRSNNKGKDDPTAHLEQLLAEDSEQARPPAVKSYLEHANTLDSEDNENKDRNNQEERQEHEHEQTRPGELAAPENSHPDEVSDEGIYSGDEDENDEEEGSEHQSDEAHGDLIIEEDPQTQNQTHRPSARLPITGADPRFHPHLYASSTVHAPPPAAPPPRADPLRKEWTMVYTCDECEAPVTVRGSPMTVRRATELVNMATYTQIYAMDSLRCRECGCRRLWKRRTTQMVQFEAR